MQYSRADSLISLAISILLMAVQVVIAVAYVLYHPCPPHQITTLD